MTVSRRVCMRYSPTDDGWRPLETLTSIDNGSRESSADVFDNNVLLEVRRKQSSSLGLSIQLHLHVTAFYELSINDSASSYETTTIDWLIANQNRYNSRGQESISPLCAIMALEIDQSVNIISYR